MFDVSWGEMLLIGAVALIVIGPKELPAALRAMGQMTSKVRRMAGEFRAQFDEAMREADVQSIRKEFDSMNDAAQGASSFNPIETIRNEIKTATEKKPDESSDSQTPSAPAAPEPESVEAATPAPEPVLPPVEAPQPVDAGAFDVTPPEPATAEPPQEAPAPRAKRVKKDPVQ